MSNKPTKECEALQERQSQNTRQANQHKKRVTTTKVLKPLAKSQQNTQSENDATAQEQVIPEDVSTGARPCASLSEDQMECVACESFLNSKNFLSTLRCCSNLCSYHRELGAFLRQKMDDLKRRK